MGVRAVVGLGNPGSRYAATRHNVGFMVLDALAEQARVRWRPGRGDYVTAETALGNTEAILMKPLTFMNRSGLAVTDFLARYGVEPDGWMVVLDDIALPLGTLRLRPRGSDGGHNGLASVIEATGTMDFARLRCGIGPAVPVPGEDLPGFVLSPFSAEERDEVKAMLAHAALACGRVAQDGLAAAMVAVNTQ